MSFSVLVSGRLLQRDGIQVDESKLVFNLENLESNNYLVVMMDMPGKAFPEGYGGSIYLSWADQNLGWQLLGHITNDKPSAIYKISGLKKKKSDSLAPLHAFSGVSNNYNTSHQYHAQIGISMEPLTEIASQNSALNMSKITNASTFEQFTATMCTGLFNYASSFSAPLNEIVQKVQQSGDVNASRAQYIRLSVIEDWFKKFQLKLNRDIYFWRK